MTSEYDIISNTQPYAEDLGIDHVRPMPQIKPLVWIGEGGSLVFATTAIGDFKCQFFKHANQWSVASNNWEAFRTCWFDSLDEAKAACEQEYERRVRECLE